MTDQPHDHVLISQWQAADRQAGTVLFERYFESVIRFFESMVPPEEAGDLAQETFLAVAAGIGNFEGRSSFRTYLFSIARRKLFDFYRKRSRKSVPDFEHISAADVLEDLNGRSPISEIAQQEQQRFLVRHLRKLSVKMQMTLVLFYWEGLSVGEIEQVLETPSGTIKRRLQRARQKLADTMRRSGIANKQITTTLQNLEQWRARILSEVASSGGKGPLGPN